MRGARYLVEWTTSARGGRATCHENWIWVHLGLKNRWVSIGKVAHLSKHQSFDHEKNMLLVLGPGSNISGGK